jgi:hypothetical protein
MSKTFINPTDPTVIKVIQALESEGFSFCHRGHNEMISAGECLDYLKDSEGFMAKRHGVTVELYRRWSNWQDGGCYCTTICKTGQQCRNQCEDVEPCCFSHGWDDTCATHRFIAANSLTP